MKTLNTKLTWLFAGALILSASPAMAQIVGSQHDLSSGGTSQNPTSSTDQVCVFCHTPHGGDTTTTSLPLWNKALPSGMLVRFRWHVSPVMMAYRLWIP